MPLTMKSIIVLRRKMLTSPAIIRPISAMKRIPPIRVRSFFVVEPISAIAPNVPAVMKKVLEIAAIL